MPPELVRLIPDELDEGNEQPPWMRPIYYESLQQHPTNRRAISDLWVAMETMATDDILLVEASDLYKVHNVTKNRPFWQINNLNSG